jgi:hypothetical protein
LSRKIWQWLPRHPEPRMTVLSLGPVGKLVLTIASTVILGFDSRRDPWPHFFKSFKCFEMGPSLQQEEGSNYNGHSPSTGEDSCPLHISSLTEQFEDQQIFTRNQLQWVSRFSQSREREKYGHRSRGARNQKWMCWGRPASNYCSAQDHSRQSTFWLAVGRQPSKTETVEHRSRKRNIQC